MESALYLGKLRHRRFSPRPHAFTYPVYMAFLDIERLPQLMQVSPWSSYNRWNWTSYHEHDHFGDPRRPLRERLERDASRQGIQLPRGPVFLLTHIRYLGYVFNPASFYYCYDDAGKVELMMAEVNNTFGQRHNYWLAASNQRQCAAANRYTSAKQMHVSPFMDMRLTYDWIFTPPGERLVAHMNTLSEGKTFFDATLELERRPWTARELHRALACFPLMTLRVIAAIHWEALKLWLKQVPVFTHPANLARAAQREVGGHAAESKGSLGA